MTIDFEVIERLRPESREDVADAFAALKGRPTRLAGRATSQDRVPAPNEPVVVLELGALDAILRLEPGDLTCSVEPGVTREQLDAALEPHRLCLPCRGAGTTIGGLFARGDAFAVTPGGHSTRSLLLGLDGVLAEGLSFKSGAKVVKSVAGFDLHKLFVGSRGRLFAATCLHLKLRPLPERTIGFCETGLTRGEAVARFRHLRRLPNAPTALVLRRDQRGFSVTGEASGRAEVVDAWCAEHAIAASGDPLTIHVDGEEAICGVEIVTRLGALLDMLPAAATFAFTGGGRFEIGLTSPDADSLLARLDDHGTAAELWRAPPDRRGRSTRPDPGSTQLRANLTTELDPGGILR